MQKYLEGIVLFFMGDSKACLFADGDDHRKGRDRGMRGKGHLTGEPSAKGGGAWVRGHMGDHDHHGGPWEEEEPPQLRPRLGGWAACGDEDWALASLCGLTCSLTGIFHARSARAIPSGASAPKPTHNLSPKTCSFSPAFHSIRYLIISS